MRRQGGLQEVDRRCGAAIWFQLEVHQSWFRVERTTGDHTSAEARQVRPSRRSFLRRRPNPQRRDLPRPHDQAQSQLADHARVGRVVSIAPLSVYTTSGQRRTLVGSVGRHWQAGAARRPTSGTIRSMATTESSIWPMATLVRIRAWSVGDGPSHRHGGPHDLLGAG